MSICPTLTRYKSCTIPTIQPRNIKNDFAKWIAIYNLAMFNLYKNIMQNRERKKSILNSFIKGFCCCSSGDTMFQICVTCSVTRNNNSRRYMLVFVASVCIELLKINLYSKLHWNKSSTRLFIKIYR